MDARGKLGRTALSYAAGEGEVETVKALLENGAEPNILADDGETPLMEASFWGHAEVVETLVDHGADVNARLTAKPHTPVRDSNGTTALMRAAIRGQISVARILLQHGADVELKNDKGETAASVAERFDNREYVRLLIKR